MTSPRPPADPRRPFLAAANWKMHFTSGEAIAYIRSLRAELAGSPSPAQLLIFPSFPLLPAVARELAGTEVVLGAQDLHTEDSGAHTGDVSGRQLADAGCRWVLCGHSERRRDHCESDDLVGRKVAAAVRHGLVPMICVGETREQRAAGEALLVLERQLRAALASHPQSFAVAYEPVWAIGTGETATAEDAREVYVFLGRLLAEIAGEVAPPPILYGGSVTPDNAVALAQGAGVEGFLVGGSCLVVSKFLAIARAAAVR